MNKNKFELFLKRGYLDGISEHLRLISFSDKMVLSFSGNSLIGEITIRESIGECELGIGSVSKLLKMIDILDDNIDIVFDDKRNNIVIKDTKNEINFMTLALSVLNKIPKLKDNISFDEELKITSDNIKTLQKAISALNEETTVSFIKSKNESCFCIGYSNNKNSDMIQIGLEDNGIIVNDFKCIKFSSEALSSIFKNNKNVDGMKIQLCYDGLLYINFNEDDCNTNYYLTKMK